MPPQPSSLPLITLRVVTQRLGATPTWQLPHVVPHLASNLLSCENIIQNAQASGPTKDSSDAGVLVHKLKTQISSLLQEKSPQSKWASVILIKAIIEIGGEEILRTSGSWVRGLLGILGRPDPDAIKELCIITLTRIFLLTQDYQSIIREITTPSLPGFITSCINILKAGSFSREKVKANGSHSLSMTTLNALCELVPHHPTLFRPFVTQTTTLVLQLIAPTPSNIEVRPDGTAGAITTTIAECSRKLFVLMNACAPKNTSGEEWTKSLRAITTSMHRTADLVFRAVIEDWEPSTRLRSSTNQVNDFSKVVGDTEQNPLGLPSWKGIYAGMERLDGILQTLQMFLKTQTSSTVNIPIGTIVDATTRILSVFPPLNESGGKQSGSMQINAEIGREEREGLWTTLPKVHISALELLLVLISRLSYGSAAICHNVLEQALWVFEREHSDSKIRNVVYDLVSKILSIAGYSLPKSVAPLLSTCMRICCEDLLPRTNKPLSRASNPTESKKGTNNRPSIGADSYLKAPNTPSITSDAPTATQISAAKLLPLAITYTSRRMFHFPLQAQIDRTAILTNNKQAMLASVLNPPLKRPGAKAMSSILPFLARQFPDLLEVEALLRPRMPVLQARNEDGSIIPDDDDHDEDEMRREDDGAENQREKAATPEGRGYLDADLVPAQDLDTFTNSAAAETNPAALVKSRPQIPLPEPPRVASPPLSHKRDRDPSPSHQSPTDMNVVQASHSPVPQDVDSSPNKRARVDPQQDITRDEAGANQLDASNAQAPSPGTGTAHPPSYTQSAPTQPTLDTDGEDSDSSAIPAIDTAMDTDEEDQ
ncbi:hypothetical protein MMC07_000952 [Pseudocyphellaria aurata]|nr:hypothetical protein [Pseudocyphellaria aurata]